MFVYLFCWLILHVSFRLFVCASFRFIIFVLVRFCVFVCWFAWVCSQMLLYVSNRSKHGKTAHVDTLKASFIFSCNWVAWHSRFARYSGPSGSSCMPSWWCNLGFFPANDRFAESQIRCRVWPEGFPNKKWANSPRNGNITSFWLEFILDLDLDIVCFSL